MQKNTPINFTTIGTTLCEWAEQGIRIIQEEANHLDIQNKIGYDGHSEDFATSGDIRTQEWYLSERNRLFPAFGVCAEEKNLTLPCTVPDHDIYFTFDPLDGTKAYIRGQSQGVGTMIGLVCNGRIVGSAIGDANTGEVYYFANDQEYGPVIRKRFGKESPLVPNTKQPLTKQYVLMREQNLLDQPFIRTLCRRPTQGGLFKNLEIGSGSIGTHFARLWKGEVGMIILEKSFETPWDYVPVTGISEQLGFQFFKIDLSTHELTALDMTPITEVHYRDYQIIVVHKEHIDELKNWIHNYKQHTDE